MTLLISDTNILVDMDVAGLLGERFQLPEDFAVPDILYVEELREQHAELPGYGLLVLEMPPEVIGEAQRLRSIYSQPSQMDLNALALAEYQGCPLLTGDRRLREAAEREQVAVNGTSWLIEAMYEAGIISVVRIEQAYEVMRRETGACPGGMSKVSYGG